MHNGVKYMYYPAPCSVGPHYWGPVNSHTLPLPPALSPSPNPHLRPVPVHIIERHGAGFELCYHGQGPLPPGKRRLYCKHQGESRPDSRRGEGSDVWISDHMRSVWSVQLGGL